MQDLQLAVSLKGQGLEAHIEQQHSERLHGTPNVLEHHLLVADTHTKAGSKAGTHVDGIPEHIIVPALTQMSDSRPICSLL